MAVKMLRGHVAVYATFPEVIPDLTAPISAADLEAAKAAGLLVDISCAIVDSAYTIDLDSSDTDDTITICDIGQVNDPTFYNYTVEFDALRNGPANLGPATPEFETVVQWFSGVDLPYRIIKRIGPEQAEPFAEGQELFIAGVTTDYPADILGNNANIMFGARFKPTGEVTQKITELVA